MQLAFICADPYHPIHVLDQGLESIYHTYGIITQTVRVGGVVLKLNKCVVFFAVFVESVPGSNPQLLFSVFNDSRNRIVGQPRTRLCIYYPIYSIPFYQTGLSPYPEKYPS